MKSYHFRKGDLIVKAKPLAASLDPQMSGKFCDQCMQPITFPSAARCENCPFANYCCLQCKKLHSDFHDKLECNFLKATVPGITDPTLRLYCHLIFNTHGKDFTQITEQLFNGPIRTFGDLMDHRGDIMNSSALYTRFRTYYAIIQDLFPEEYIPSEDRAIQIFGRMIINRFSIQSEELDPIGESLYVGPSIHDHSCKPDAAFTFNGSVLSIRALREMAVSDPREIYICYIDVLQTKMERITYLEEHYFFRCACPYCGKGGEKHVINNIDTSRQSTSDYLRSLLATCQKTDDMDNFIHLYKNVKKLLDDDGYEEDTEENLKYWKIDAYIVALECAIKSVQYNEAYSLGRRLLSVFRMVYGDNRPCISVLLYRLSAISKYLASDTYQTILGETRSHLRVTHGVDHPLTRDVDRRLSFF